MLTPWEYTVLVLTPEQLESPLTIQSVLTEMGRDGWEHYDTQKHENDEGVWEQRYYFKRPK